MFFLQVLLIISMVAIISDMVADSYEKVKDKPFNLVYLVLKSLALLFWSFLGIMSIN